MCKKLKQFIFHSVLLVMVMSCTQNESTVTDSVSVSEQLLLQQQDTALVLHAIRSAQDSLSEAARSVNQLLGEMRCNNPNAAMRIVSGEQIYDVVVLADCELDFRGLSYNELYAKIGKIAGIGTRYTNLRYNDGSLVQKPQLALIAGDLTGDRATTTTWNNLQKILNQLNNNGIYTFANIGNHDWETCQWGDGSYGYTFAGFSSNIRSIKDGVLPIFQNAINSINRNGAAAYFTNIDSPFYISFSLEGLKTSAPIYGFTYKGVDYVMGPTFLYQPTCKLTIKSLFGLGHAGFSEGLSASYLTNRASRVKATTRIYVQHYPYSCANEWNDYYSGKSVARIQSDFRAALKSANVSTMFSGHKHLWNIDKCGDITDYTVANVGNPGRPAFFMMVRVSSTRGVIQVKNCSTDDLF